MNEVTYKFRGKQEYAAFLSWYKDNKKELYSMYYGITQELDEGEFIDMIVIVWQDVRHNQYVIKN